ncbi:MULTISPECIES: RDD family protein [unclassified Nocardioides]|uniref:RDD family protein n=1 Tax=unclassified Nocardioides TaxID=2615069 RepID=UPI00070281A5|nr:MULTISPECIES: RDD family protein [unclassified Nocardioides]KQP65615.1 hypothetical protein ASF47_07575 [Nocardioides sp. Leaf285]
MSLPHAQTSLPPTARTDASAGQRVGALLLDTLLVMAPLFVVAGILFGDSQAGDGGASVSLTGVPFLLTLLVAAGYFLVLELTTGQTLGKKIVGIRVVSDKGGDVTAVQALVRTALRVVDGFAFYLVAFVAVLASPRNQRLGDMAASTRVVRAR